MKKIYLTGFGILLLGIVSSTTALAQIARVSGLYATCCSRDKNEDLTVEIFLDAKESGKGQLIQRRGIAFLAEVPLELEPCSHDERLICRIQSEFAWYATPSSTHSRIDTGLFDMHGNSLGNWIDTWASSSDDEPESKTIPLKCTYSWHGLSPSGC